MGLPMVPSPIKPMVRSTEFSQATVGLGYFAAF
jgi:hypothetical protein